MNLAERKLLQKIDDVVLNASSDELKKIQEYDIQTQLNGGSFYEEYVNSDLANEQIQQETRDTKGFKK